jgi:tRNA (guanine-N7-)-methyltransferase
MIDKSAAAPSPPRHGAVFGRRKGKKLRAYQSGLLDRALPGLTFDLSHGVVDPASLFDSNVSEIRLEIGFGGGEHLAAQADRDREVGFIGCEPFVNGVAKALAKIDSLQLENVRLYQGDAGEVLRALPENCVNRVAILYPDPWPKRRQRKRRFISDEMLERLARVMRIGAELRFATDIDDYAAWTLARVLRSPDFTWRAVASRDWLQPWEGWPGTRYEAKALAASRVPVYLTFVRSWRGP